MAEGSRRPEWRRKESVLRLACSLERIPGTLCSTCMPKRERSLDPAKQASTNGFSRSHQDPLSYGSGEGQNVEFKRGISDDANRTGPVEDELLKSVAAFANTNDGVILIGIDDAGHVKGLALDFKQRDKLEQKIHQLIRPAIDQLLLFGSQLSTRHSLIHRRQIFRPSHIPPIPLHRRNSQLQIIGQHHFKGRRDLILTTH